MDTPKRLQEHISAMVDGELSAHEAGPAMAALTEPEGRAAWRAYHLIGDVLRSDASGAELGEDFTARLAARLDVEVPPAPGRAAPAAAPALAPALVPAVAPALAPAQPAAGESVPNLAAPVPDTAV